MDSRWTQRWPGIAVASGLVVSLVFAPAASAATCALSAPAYGNVGTPLAIAGSGFPTSAAVDIEIRLDGVAFDSFSVQSDAGGAIDLELTPEVADIGVWTIDASAGSACSAQVVIQVLGANQTPVPEATSPPDGSAGGADASAAPRTDASLSMGPSTPNGVPLSLWAIGFLVFLTGLVGSLVTRPKRNT